MVSIQGGGFCGLPSNVLPARTQCWKKQLVHSSVFVRSSTMIPTPSSTPCAIVYSLQLAFLSTLRDRTTVVFRGGLCFCVNDEFAEDFHSFRESVLWSSFAHIHPPTTGADLIGNRGFFRVDLSVNRKDDCALLTSLERAYGLEKAILLDMQVHSTSMLHIRKRRRELQVDLPVSRKVSSSVSQDES